MASAINTTLNERPETFNRVRVNDTTSVLFSGMFDMFMGVSEFGNKVITSEFISIDFGIDVDWNLFPEDRHKRSSFDVGDYLSHNLSIVSLNDSHDRRFVFETSTDIIRLTTKIRFIDCWRSRSVTAFNLTLASDCIA